MSKTALFLLLLFLTACGGPAYRSQVLDTPETRHLKGHQKPYTVNGQRYNPLPSHQGFVEDGTASWYGPDFHGKSTSNGEIYDMYAMTAAHKTLPLGVWVKVTNQANGKSATVRVNDRGPFVKGRIIDLSFAAAKTLDVVAAGTAPVHIEALGFRDPATGDYRPAPRYNAGPFTIQVGAFTVPDNARRLADQLRSQFGSSSIQQGWVNNKLFHRVRVGRYNSLTEAEAARGRFEAGGYPNSFVVALD